MHLTAKQADVYTLTTDGGYEISCTERHKFDVVNKTTFALYRSFALINPRSVCNNVSPVTQRLEATIGIPQFLIASGANLLAVSGL